MYRIFVVFEHMDSPMHMDLRVVDEKEAEKEDDTGVH